jgi:ankyrin repeat protein
MILFTASFDALTTPLHFAAYNNYPEQIEILLEYGADINITDNLQDRPLDTVRRHGSFRCHQILQRADMTNLQNFSPEY